MSHKRITKLIIELLKSLFSLDLERGIQFCQSQLGLGCAGSWTCFKLP